MQGCEVAVFCCTLSCLSHSNCNSQVEAQFGQLRNLIQSSLQQTADAALLRQQAEEGAPPLPHGAVHMRASEDLPPADSPVQHHHVDVGGAAAGSRNSGKVKGLKHRKGAPPPDLRGSPESSSPLHSL